MQGETLLRRLAWSCCALQHLKRMQIGGKQSSAWMCHLCRRTLRECMLLRHLKHENVIGLREILLPASMDFKDLYIVQDLMDTDLHQIIRSAQPLSNEHLQYFIYQVGRLSPCDMQDLTAREFFLWLPITSVCTTHCRS